MFAHPTLEWQGGNRFVVTHQIPSMNGKVGKRNLPTLQGYSS